MVSSEALPGGAAFGPPAMTTHAGGGVPGFIVLNPLTRSADVFPESSLIRVMWCISFPVSVILIVVKPAGIESGASNLYSDAWTFTTFGAAATVVAGAAALSAEASFGASFTEQPASATAA